ncbi:MAG: recombinase family protein [Nitrospinae bacterium]|nr:recombinase family protein [Nitrospinota bacterium]
MGGMKASANTGTRDSRYAVIYLRVSTEDQGKGFSIPTQLEACQTFAAHEGYSVPDGYVLIDDGISGATLERPGFQKLRELAKARAIQGVIVYDLDRLSRKLGHQLLLSADSHRSGPESPRRWQSAEGRAGPLGAIRRPPHSVQPGIHRDDVFRQEQGRQS